MEPFEFPEDITVLSAEDLAASETGAIEAFDALRAIDPADLTDEQLDEMEALAAHVQACREQAAARETAAANRQARIEAAAAAVAPPEVEAADEGAEVTDEVEDPDESGEPEPEDGEPEQDQAVDGTETVAASATRRRSVVATVPKKAVVKPPSRTQAVITAAADVPDVPAGSRMGDLHDVAKAFIARSKAFPHTKPGEQPRSRTRHQYPIATFSRGDFDGLTDEDTRYADGMALLAAAGDEKRLPGQSLTASGGWCAPSETIYDLCDNRASLDGLWDTPEMGITRGGIRFTQGIDWRPVFAGGGYLGFWQTEAQAIAGTTKDCFEVTCNEFDEERLDAVGVCIKAPILTNVAYPELVRQWIEGTLIAQQHRVSATLLHKAVNALGPAVPLGGAGGLTYEMLTSLELVGLGLKEDERMSFGETLEIVVPHWIKAAIRGDLANRTGVDMLAVSDQQITAYFAARGLRIQFVYNWQGLGGSPVIDYPDTVTVAMYPAGTFVKGTADVISLDTVYDSTDLTSNIYTAAFVEEGVLLAQRCGNGTLVEIPVCVSGQTGAADLSDCYGTSDTSHPGSDGFIIG